MPRYIDADALRDALYEADAITMKGVRILNQFPTITPDDVRGVGEWEQKEIFGVEETTIEQMQSACCSVCGKYHTTPYSYYFSKYNYCPNCGAKMNRAEAEKAMEVSEDE